jgi:hypothetical protein
MNNISGTDAAESPMATFNTRNCRESVASSSSRASSSSSAITQSSSSSLTISSSSSASVNNLLNCTGLQSVVERGGVITTPTLECSNGNAITSINWRGGPTSGWNPSIDGWQVSANTPTTSYTISVTTNCGSGSISADCGVVNVVDPGTAISSSSIAASSSSTSVTPIALQQTLAGNIRAYTNAGNIILENLPANAKIEIYNLQGQRIYVSVRALRATPQQERIEVQTKGFYIIKVTSGSERKILRVSVM